MTNYKVQSIIFDKDQIDFEEALDWITCHGDKIKHIDETDTQYIFRQLSQKYLKSIGYTNYKTKRLNEVVSLIIVYKRNQTKKIIKRIPWKEDNPPSAIKNVTDFIKIY